MGWPREVCKPRQCQHDGRFLRTFTRASACATNDTRATFFPPPSPRRSGYGSCGCRTCPRHSGSAPPRSRRLWGGIGARWKPSGVSRDGSLHVATGMRSLCDAPSATSSARNYPSGAAPLVALLTTRAPPARQRGQGLRLRGRHVPSGDLGPHMVWGLLRASQPPPCPRGCVSPSAMSTK